ncbi:MAG: FlgO family outer membrane protein [Thermodesulfobacteriota bacterium]|nr:FlgO family outer membrane protein [Thermodesulfobacteriota bacterium]
MKNFTKILITGSVCMMIISAGVGCSSKHDIATEQPCMKPPPPQIVTSQAAEEPVSAAVAPVPAVVAPVPAAVAPPNLGNRIVRYMPDASRSLGTEILLSELGKEVAGKVYYELKDGGERHLSSRVAVVSAVPLSDLKRETEFGRMLAEYILTDLADRGLKVTELRMGKEINILPLTGEFIMSRNIGELANNSPMLDYVVLTTFSNTRKTLIVQGRLVSLKNGLIETSWRYSMPLNRELLGLFHDVEQPFSIAVKGVGQ